MSTSILDNEIIVDIQEKAGTYEIMLRVQAWTPKALDLVIHQGSLLCGDLKFRNLGAERKSIRDFIGSIQDSRIFAQAFKMSQNYAFPYLLVSGNPMSVPERDQKAIFTTCADVESRYGFRIMFCPSDLMLCHYFLMLCYKHAKELKPLWHFKKPTITAFDEQEAMIESVQHIGRKTKDILMAHYHSLPELINASASQLQTVVGPKTGIHLYEILHKSWK